MTSYSTFTPTKTYTEGINVALGDTDFSPLIYTSMTSADNRILAALDENNITPLININSYIFRR